MNISSASNLPPDPEITARAWCLEKTAITDIVSTRVATRLPQNPTLPFLVITNGGGSLISDTSQAAINGTSIIFNCYAGRWGGSGSKGEPDYTTASNLAQAVYKECFIESNNQVTTASGVKALIYGFTIQSTPTRVEESELLIANFELVAFMTYRASAQFLNNTNLQNNPLILPQR